MKKRFCVLFLAVIMVFTILPISAFATVNVQGGTSQGQDSDGTYIYVSDSDSWVEEVEVESDKLKVNGPVVNDTSGSAVSASDSAKVTVADNVYDCNSGDAINASDLNTTVTVKGYVGEYDEGNAINATSGAKVTVEGNVTESGAGNAIYAQNKAIVIVFGGVVENGAGSAINANNSTVIVGGDVTEKRDASGTSIAVMASNGAEVIVEGKVTADGDIVADNSALYLGQLDGEIGYERPYVHYLIGIAPEGSVALSEVTIVSAIVADDTIDGINEEGYRYTTTAEKTDLSGQTIILKPAAGKKLSVSGFDGADVTCVKNADGTVTFTLGSEFKGGLQNLVLKLEETPYVVPQTGDSSRPVLWLMMSMLCVLAILLIRKREANG